jgi:nitroreductase
VTAVERPPDLDRLLAERYSCRAFRPDLVDAAVVDEVLTLAQRAPSWCNTQPWQVHLLGGDGLTRFSAGLEERVLEGRQTADLDLPDYTGVHAERRRESGFGLYGALGIDRADRAARDLQMFRNFSFFGAPHAVVVTTDRALGSYGVLDCGGYVSTLMLAAQSRGLGVIAQGAIALYSDYVRDFLDLPEDRVVVCGVAFGKARHPHPANDFRTTRADLTGVVHRIDH